VEIEVSDEGARFSFQVTNQDHYARLLRLRAEWDDQSADAFNPVSFKDNYFDLLPGETRTIEGKLVSYAEGKPRVAGKLIVQGSNVAEKTISLQWKASVEHAQPRGSASRALK
jgi:hypothetical protein